VSIVLLPPLFNHDLSLLAERYTPNVRYDFSAVYFNDPTRYVHVDDEGRIALSYQDLADQCFVSTDLKELDSLSDTQEYKERSERWRYFFLETEGCAYCEAWRICLGKFCEYAKRSDGCSSFFKEFLAAIELYQEAKNRKMTLWQP
jgi:hypothetical protein